MMNNTKPTWRDNLKALGYLLPMLIIVGMFSLYPIIKTTTFLRTKLMQLGLIILKRYGRMIIFT